MQKWEYLTLVSLEETPWIWVKGDGDETAYKTIAEAGLDGWEMFSVNYKDSDRWFYFKRPVINS